MWTPIKNILIKIQRNARRRSLIAATKEANKICLETGKTMLIYFYKGEYRYISKQDVKKAGMSGEEAEAIAQAKIVRYMNTKDKKPTPEEIKKLQEQTIKKQGKIVTK